MVFDKILENKRKILFFATSCSSVQSEIKIPQIIELIVTLLWLRNYVVNLSVGYLKMRRLKTSLSLWT